MGLIELESRSVTDMWSHLHICLFLKKQNYRKKDQKINEMINFTITGLFLGFGVAQDTRPNIVFALVDDLGKMCISQ